MNVTADPNLLVMAALIFLLGLLVGVFLTAGGRRKWKTRFDSEVERRKELERTRDEREKHWAAQEKEWRERDALRDSAVRSRRDPADDRPA